MRSYRSCLYASVFILMGLGVLMTGCKDNPTMTEKEGPETGKLTGSAAEQSQPELDVENHYIVVLKSKATIGEVAGNHGLSPTYRYSHALNGFAAHVKSDKALQALQKNPNVKYVEKDQAVHAIAQTLPAGIDRIEVDQNSTANIDNTDDGMDVDIGIIDTGIDHDHPDLNLGGNGIDCIDAGTTNDNNGHGTHVSGSAAAIDNESHVVGAAPGARVHPIKVLDSGGSGTISSVVCGIDHVTANADTFEVANMSLGAQGSSSSMRDAIQNSEDAGIYYAVAAGNDAADVYGSDGTFGTSDDFIPAAYPEVATVSAMADYDGTDGSNGGSQIFTGCGRIVDDTFAECFSNYSQSVVSGNPVTSPGAAIDVAAPGVSVLSTTNDGSTGELSGTSMSSPHVAGVAALYIVENGLSPGSASDVHSIRQALIDNGQAQSNWQDGSTNDPDDNPEPLVMAVFEGSSSDSPPSVTITNPGDGDTVSGTVTVTADASDDSGVDQVEFLVDGNSIGTDSDGSDGWSTDWNTENYEDGDHTVTAEATDDAGQTASDQITVTVDNTTEVNMHVGDLDGNSLNNGSTWTAEITATVHDSNHDPLSEATVSFSYDGREVSGTESCTTAGDGQCTVSVSGIPKRTGDLTFTVEGVSHSDYTYDQNDNHDPDGDSDGTTITVQK